MEHVLSVALGIGLAAACGFRVFVPLLIVSAAARWDYLALSDGFAWVESTPALVIFGVATVLEIGAYYIPWLDNALDTITSPAAVVAGAVVAASAITGMDPMLKWTLALIAGGGVAGAVQAVTGVSRVTSTVGTGGLANPLVSTVEVVGAVGFSLLAIVWPLLAVLLLVILAALALRWYLARRARRRYEGLAA